MRERRLAVAQRAKERQRLRIRYRSPPSPQCTTRAPARQARTHPRPRCCPRPGLDGKHGAQLPDRNRWTYFGVVMNIPDASQEADGTSDTFVGLDP